MNIFNHGTAILAFKLTAILTTVALGCKYNFDIVCSIYFLSTVQQLNKIFYVIARTGFDMGFSYI